MIKAVIFDMDGLLLDSERISMNFRAETHSGLGVEFTEMPDLVGKNATDVKAIYRKVFGSDEIYEEVQRRKKLFWSTYLEQHKIPVKEGVHELVHLLQQMHIPYAVATSTSETSAKAFLANAGILDQFDTFVFGDMVEHSKPNPDIFLKAAEMLHTAPEDCLVLEDSPNGARAGLAANMQTVIVVDLIDPDPELRGQVAACVNSLKELIPLIDNKNIREGDGVSLGIAIGEALVYAPYVPHVEERTIAAEEVETEIARYEALQASAKQELTGICGRFKDDDKGDIFKAHIDILFDAAIDEEIRDAIELDHQCADWAIFSVFEKYVRIMKKKEKALFRERANDIHDVELRLLRISQGVSESNLSMLEKPQIIVAKDLLPSDTALMDRKNVLALVTEEGGTTSHSAIIARSYGIPALLGVKGIMSEVQTGQQVIVDAVKGQIILNPAPEQLETAQQEKERFDREKEDEARFLNRQGVLKDGTPFSVCLNIASASSQELEGLQYTDGVGLFRTEFIYMGRSALPTEEMQFEIYKTVLEKAEGKPIILRTLDIGGDKTLECMELPKEENPFLGTRALRLCFDREDVFITQLRAALRASVYGSLWIMLPMVGSLEDIRKAKKLIADTKAALLAEGCPVSDDVKVGIMIEIPSIAMMADVVAEEVDFASIGTNDLTQYLLAADRVNPEVSAYYQPYHPAVFRLIGYAAKCFNKANKPISVCGELGGDPLVTSTLVGLGVNKLSMGCSSVAKVKKILSMTDLEEAKLLAQQVQKLGTAQEVKAFLTQQADK